MKFTIAIAALLAASMTETQAITLWTTNGQVAYEESDSESDAENVQLSANTDTDGPPEYFHAGATGTLGKLEYARVVPARFASDNDDIFMRSMISNYALEEKTKDGLPSGKFFMNKATMMAAAREVLATHKGLSGKALEDYLNTYFEKAWGHYDVMRTGRVAVEFSPLFMRFLASDQYMSFQPGM
jgi:hypothetical protein